jgi:Tfp pilus assembly protein PilF
MAGKKDDVSKKGTKSRGDNDIKIMTNFENPQDLEFLLNDISKSNLNSEHTILDLKPKFLAEHSSGVEMFLKMAIDLEPKNPTHHYNYALYLETQKVYDMARNEFETALKFDKNNETIMTDYANLLFMLKDYQGAEKHYKAALKLKPDDVHIWANLGLLYQKRNQFQKAEKILKKAISINPNFPLSYLNLLQLYEQNGKAEKAKDLWKKYRSLNEEILDVDRLHLDLE